MLPPHLIPLPPHLDPLPFFSFSYSSSSSSSSSPLAPPTPSSASPFSFFFPKASVRSYLSLASNITRERVPPASCSSTPNTVSTSLRHLGGCCVMSYTICTRWTLTGKDIHLSYILLSRLSGSSVVTEYCKQQTLESEVPPLQSGSGGLSLVSLYAGVTLLAHGCSPSPPTWSSVSTLSGQ